MFNDKFNNYTETSDFSAHTANTSIHVTTADKETWNGKQDAIEDLEEIRNNALSGASAYTECIRIDEKVDELSGNVIDSEYVIAQTLNMFNDKFDEIEQSIEDVDDRVDELSGNVVDNEFVIAQTLNMFNDKLDDIDDTIDGLATVATTGSYTDLLNTPTSNTAFTNDAGYITTADTQDFVTSGDVKSQIEAYEYVNSGNVKTQIENYNYVTSAETKTQVEAYNYVTSAETKTQIEAYDYLPKSDTYFDGAEYNSTDKKIYFKKGNDIISAATIDATDFIKDGMVSNVEITSGSGAYVGQQVLKITFNTDAGQSPIEIPLTDIFDPSNYYSKNDIDGMNLINASTFSAHTADTNVHVTTQEKSTWSGKQDAISDLSDIRNNASSGASAYTQVQELAIIVEEDETITAAAINDLNDRFSGYTELSDFSAHTADTTVHVSSQDKTTWNGKQDAIGDLSTIRNNALSGSSAYTEVMVHTADTTVHVTSQDKTTWNGKQDTISDLTDIRNNASSGASAYTAVTAHTADTTIHLPSVTSADNGKILKVINNEWSATTPNIVLRTDLASQVLQPLRKMYRR